MRLEGDWDETGNEARNEANQVLPLGRQRWGGVPHRRTSLRPYLVVSAPSAGVSNICKAKNYVLLLVQSEEHMNKSVLLMEDPSPLCLPR